MARRAKKLLRAASDELGLTTPKTAKRHASARPKKPSPYARKRQAAR